MRTRSGARLGSSPVACSTGGDSVGAGDIVETTTAAAAAPQGDSASQIVGSDTRSDLVGAADIVETTTAAAAPQGDSASQIVGSDTRSDAHSDSTSVVGETATLANTVSNVVDPVVSYARHPPADLNSSCTTTEQYKPYDAEVHHETDVVQFALSNLGLSYQDVEGDGNCFFYCLQSAVHSGQSVEDLRMDLARKLREEITKGSSDIQAQIMAAAGIEEGDVEGMQQYIGELSRPNRFIEGEIEINMAAQTFDVNIVVYQYDDEKRMLGALSYNGDARKKCFMFMHHQSVFSNGGPQPKQGDEVWVTRPNTPGWEKGIIADVLPTSVDVKLVDGPITICVPKSSLHLRRGNILVRKPIHFSLLRPSLRSKECVAQHLQKLNWKQKDLFSDETDVFDILNGYLRAAVGGGRDGGLRYRLEANAQISKAVLFQELQSRGVRVSKNSLVADVKTTLMSCLSSRATAQAAVEAQHMKSPAEVSVVHPLGCPSAPLPLTC